MKLYISHSTSFDYRSKLYDPLRATLAKVHEVILPHEQDTNGVNTKDIIATCDSVFAEVSYPSTGQGIELGWASANDVPIICFYLRGSQPSTALKFVCTKMIEYDSSDDMVQKLDAEIGHS